VELSGSEIIIQFLKDEGVKHIFGYPGGAVLHIYDALQKQTDVEHILVRHEQGASHAADGYARATGKPGVCLVTSGPGATNAITGIATAYMDSIPLVVLTGQVPSHVGGADRPGAEPRDWPGCVPGSRCGRRLPPLRQA
jgi:acetolactate synthase-1/2/3 large subunit